MGQTLHCQQGMHPPPAWGGRGANIPEKSLQGGVRNPYFGGRGGGYFVGGSRNFEVKIETA